MYQHGKELKYFQSTMYVSSCLLHSLYICNNYTFILSHLSSKNCNYLQLLIHSHDQFTFIYCIYLQSTITIILRPFNIVGGLPYSVAFLVKVGRKNSVQTGRHFDRTSAVVEYGYLGSKMNETSIPLVMQLFLSALILFLDLLQQLSINHTVQNNPY